jgi:succinate-semialdehyde dehydrogenase/glutarate-semialdehyde dehydrogenase
MPMSSYLCLSPNNGTVLSQIELSDRSKIHQWISSRYKTVVAEKNRLTLLTQLSERILQSTEALSQAIQDEVGKTPAEAHGEVLYAASFVEAAVVALKDQLQQRLSNPKLPAKAPLGPALLISAFNDPIAGITRKLAPAIAAGCSVVIKPSPLGFLCARALEEILPDGLREHVVFAYLENPHEIKGLIEDSDISIVSMTGSTLAGRQIAQSAGKKAIPCVLELGGNCPLVVFKDADLEKAARDILDRKTRAAGQACSAVNRVLADARIIKELECHLEALEKHYPCGPSQRTDIVFGPVRHRESVERLRRLESQALALGARLVFRASVINPETTCLAYPLTALRLDADSPFDHEEAFGPSFVIRQFTNDAELEALLDANRQNLAAYFYGKKAEQFLTGRPWIRFGSIGINTTRIQGPDVPTGGFGEAGYGREGGSWGIEEFQATVNIKGAFK